MAGVLQRHFGQFNLGMVVTNTAFTREAEWFVRKFELFLRLRNGEDVQRWVKGDFASMLERRDFPSSLQLMSKLMLQLDRQNQS